MLYRPERGWGFHAADGKVDAEDILRRVERLEARQRGGLSDEYAHRLDELEKRLRPAKLDDQGRRAEDLESASARRIG
jgi:hypothetical protein